MCGRYRLSRAELYGEINDVRIPPTALPRFNICPTQNVLVVLDESPGDATEVRWGLVPFWSKDVKDAAKMINARAETVTTKPAFRDAYKKRRCVIPADGFYEWQKTGAGKQPYHIGLKSDEPFAFAGLWERWNAPDGQEIRTCTILTCEPNALTEKVHNRMPVILSLGGRKVWLDKTAPLDVLPSLLKPYDAELMQAYPISPLVNSPRNDGCELINPL